jgi:hypothetical protein
METAQRFDFCDIRSIQTKKESKNMTTLDSAESMNRSPVQRGLFFVSLALACLVLTPQARAQGCNQGCDVNQNTFFGSGAFLNNTTGKDNTAIGDETLRFNTTGLYNTAIGFNALYSNTIGTTNAASGYRALYANTDGNGNTATGLNTLQANRHGSQNTATGLQALLNNSNASDNTATGSNALNGNTSGYRNTATGSSALGRNAGGNNNVADGFAALGNNLGSNNVAVGASAGLFLTAGSGNICIGANVFGVAHESNTTRIGNVYASAASGRAVYVNADNKIGTLVSSRRFKEQIKPMDKASEAILALKPVSFHYKKEIEPNGPIMFGLIAEDVEKVDSALVTRNEKGEAETVRYDQVNAMLLNEFLKEHRKTQNLEVTVAQQQKQIEALTAGLQKVTDQLALRKPALRTVLNHR